MPFVYLCKIILIFSSLWIMINLRWDYSYFISIFVTFVCTLTCFPLRGNFSPQSRIVMPMTVEEVRGKFYLPRLWFCCFFDITRQSKINEMIWYLLWFCVVWDGSNVHRNEDGAAEYKQQRRGGDTAKFTFWGSDAWKGPVHFQSLSSAEVFLDGFPI